MRNIRLSSFERGQTLLIVVLVMIVALTIGLSVVTRSITTLRTTQEEEQSQQAFSAAEAGIEKIINSGSANLQGQLSNDASFNASVTSLAGANVLVNGGNLVAKDDGVDIWLSTYPTYASPFTGTVTVYWGTSNDDCDESPSINTQSAIVIVTLTGTTANPVMTRYALDPCSARASGNGLSTTILPGGTINGKAFANSYSINVTNGLLMRIIPLYASTIIGVSGNGTALPSQGQVVEATGNAGETTRKITVYKGYPRLPVEFFPFGIFSP